MIRGETSPDGFTVELVHVSRSSAHALAKKSNGEACIPRSICPSLRRSLRKPKLFFINQMFSDGTVAIGQHLILLAQWPDDNNRASNCQFKSIIFFSF